MSNANGQLRSRRSLLAAIGGGVAAYATAALGRPQGAAAGTTGTYLELGEDNTATATTSIVNEDPNEVAFRAVATAGGTGLEAESETGTAIFASSMTGYGLYALSETGRGIGVSSSTNHALYADNFSASRPAIMGAARGDAAGVMGYSGAASPPAAWGNTGVYGFAAQNVEASGVVGASTVGSGILGIATSGHAVHASASSGIGVYASSTSSGFALHASSRVEFETSGLVTIPVGSRAATVSTGYDIGPATRVLCTLESDQGGLFIHRVTKDVATDTFRVVLSRVVASGRSARVAWFVIG